MENKDFLKENGLLLSKFEEAKGRILFLKSQLKSQNSELDGLKFELKQQQTQIGRLKISNSQLKKKVSELEQGLKEQSILIPQNFKIKNKLVKIVTNIEENESVQEIDMKDYLNALIEEIDICINQLSE